MCLYTEVNAKPSVAESDIVVYKVVKIIKGVEGQFVSPFQNMDYVPGQSYTTEFSSDTDEIFSRYDELYRFYELASKDADSGKESVGIIERGIHSFVELGDAQEYVAVDHRCESHTILKCVIPAGAEYHKGIWLYQNYFFSRAYEVDSYASTALTVIEEVK